MRIKAKWLFFVMLLIHLIPDAEAQDKLILDLNTNYQIMEGFGASDAWRMQFVGKNWPLEKKRQIADLLFSREFDKKGNPKGIGLSLWRFYIGAGSTEQGEGSGIKNEWRRAECFIGENGEYDWTKEEGQQWFLKAANERGVEKFLAFSIAPPVFWSVNQKAYSIKANPHLNIKVDKLDDYADFLADVIDHFEKNKGISFDYISPFNEPQWDWSKANQEGTPATNEELFTFVEHLSGSLYKRKLQTEIVIGEAGDIRYLFDEYNKPDQGDQIKAFFSPGSPFYLGALPNVKKIISGHSYFTTWPIKRLITTREALNEKRLSIDPDLGYWQSEFCILEKTDEIGDGQERDLGMNTAIYVSRVIHADITLAQASSWQWWTALTTFNYKDGLIYLDTGDEHDLFNRDSMKTHGEIRESKLLWAFGNFSRFVRPGMQRTGMNFTSNLSDSDLLVSAYYDKTQKEVVVILINQSDQKKKLDIKDTNIRYDRKYITSKKHNLDYGPVRGGMLRIPARSVVTLLGHVKDEFH